MTTSQTPYCLPRADRRPPSERGQPAHRARRLVGQYGRPGATHRHGQIFRHLPECHWRLCGSPARQPARRRHYGLDFPVITIGDMVRAQNVLLDRLKIPDLFCVIGGSMGGMQVLQWAAAHGERVFSAIPIATAARHSRKTSLFTKLADSNSGRHGLAWWQLCRRTAQGLAVARMTHITYLSEAPCNANSGATATATG